jgi:hypothetical protein
MKLSIILGLIFTLTSNICYSFDLFNPDRGKASESRKYSKPTISKSTGTTEIRRRPNPSSSKNTKSRSTYTPNKTKNED